ncbi:hypothetical protein FOZ63_023415, partial [Perkinsus olseni]
SAQQQQMMMMAAAAAAASAMGGGNNNDAPPAAAPRSAWANHHNNVEFTREMRIPQKAVGKAIGRGGETILMVYLRCVLDEIRRRSGCRVQLQPVAVEDGSPRSAKVVGNADAVRACVDLLNDVI